MKFNDSLITKDVIATALMKSSFYDIALARRGSIASVKKIAKRTIEVAIKLPDNFDFIAGQYIWLQIPQLKYLDQRGNTRMFSIASSPSKKRQLDIVFRTSESGYKKTLIESVAGTEIIFSGPFGPLKLPEDSLRPVILVAGGIGVAPFLSMIRFSAEIFSRHNITLIWANPSNEEAIYVDELASIEKASANFNLVKVFGRLKNSHLKQIMESTINSNAVWYIVGPQSFVDSTTQFLHGSGVLPENIIFEEFYSQTPSELAFKKNIYAAPLLFAPMNPFFTVVKNASNHIIITDANGMILYANKGAENMTGYTFAEMKGSTPRLWGGLMPRDFYVKLWKTIKQDRQIFSGEIKNRRKNQEQYHAFVRISPIIDNNDTLVGFVATEEDITHLKEKEGGLKNIGMAFQNLLEDLRIEKSKVEVEKAKDEALLASIGDGIIATDKEGNIIIMNHAAVELLHESEANFLGKRIYEIVKMYNSKSTLVPTSERPIIIALSSGKSTTTATTTTHEIIYFYEKKNGIKFPVAITVTPIMLNKNIIGAIEVFRDITKEINIDKAKTEFVSLASHQLRTPSTAVKWNAEMLFDKKTGNLTKKQEKYLQEVYHGNERMIKLIDNLLSVSRLELGKIVPKE